MLLYPTPMVRRHLLDHTLSFRFGIEQRPQLQTSLKLLPFLAPIVSLNLAAGSNQDALKETYVNLLRTNGKQANNRPMFRIILMQLKR